MQVSTIASTGAVLSVAQKAALTSSLPLLKKRNKFSQVCFFGKITGITADYLIAIGIEEGWTTKKQYFFCHDGVSWGMLPTPTDEDMAKFAKLPAGLMLTGDASTIYTLPLDAPPEGEEPPEDPVAPTLDELTRLAMIVLMIDTDCAMAPKGSLAMRASGAVVPSPTFVGLSAAAALDVGSYVFINKPKPKDVLTPAAEMASDFLLPASSIVPKGALVARTDDSNDCVIVRSLLWPGFTAMTKPGTPSWGYCYFGSGMKNADIAFMLP